MRKILFILITVLFLFGGYQLAKEWRDAFSVANITFDLAEHPEWRVPPLSQEEENKVKHILDQPYTYLDKGHQVYAFESKDQQYVLKFIKFTYLKPASWLDRIPDLKWIRKYKDHVAKGKSKRINRVFAGYRMAYEIDKESSGLLYIHLMPTKTLKQRVHLTDRFGFTYSIDLDQHAFILQKKALLSRLVIQNLLNGRDVSQAKDRLLAMVDMYLRDYKKSLYDSDHNIMYNTGFVEDRVIRLDSGRLQFDPNVQNADFIKKDLQKIVYKRIQRWLKAYYPQYKDELMQSLDLWMKRNTT